MGLLPWLVGLLALTLLSGWALISARRLRAKGGYVIVAVEREKGYSK